GVRGHPEVGIGTGQADGAGAGRRQAAGRAGVVGRAAALRRAGFVPATCGRLVGPVPTRTFAPTGVASLAGIAARSGPWPTPTVAARLPGPTTRSRVVLPRPGDGTVGNRCRTGGQKHCGQAEGRAPGHADLLCWASAECTRPVRMPARSVICARLVSPSGPMLTRV